MSEKANNLVLGILAICCFSRVVFAQQFGGRVYEGNVGDESTPIPNATVKLYASQDINNLGTEIARSTTDSRGWYGLQITQGYEFYTLIESDPTGYTSVGATSVDGTIINANRIQYSTVEKPLQDQTLTGNKFWDKKTAGSGIGNLVWHDLNQNGIQDEGEPGEPGVTVELYDSDGNMLASTVTDANGNYKFSGLTSGNYIICFALSSGYQFTNQNMGSDDAMDSDADPSTGETTVSLSSGEHDNTIDAGVIEGDIQILDFGDAPDPSYPTLLSHNGARHTIVEGVHLGTLVDAEMNGQPNSDATGDNLDNQNDEDGIVFLNDLVPGAYTSFVATVSQKGNLGVWVDLNGNGNWNDPGESLFINDTTVFAGANTWGFKVPPSAPTGFTMARFRYSTVGGQTVDGPWPDGEVEDYRVEIKSESDLGTISVRKQAHPRDNTLFHFNGTLGPFTLRQPSDSMITFAGLQPGRYRIQELVPAGWTLSQIVINDATANSSFDLSSANAYVQLDGNEHILVTFNNHQKQENELDYGDAPSSYDPGPAHFGLAIDPSAILGKIVDGEPTYQADPNALGDDNHNLDDEDGVFFTTPLIQGQPAMLQVDLTNVSTPDFLVRGAVDYDGDGQWSISEYIFYSEPWTAGIINMKTFVVPNTAKPGATFARFHIIDTGPGPPDGQPKGEVEDYKITILEGDGLAAVGNRVWHDINQNGLQDQGEAGLPNVKVDLYESGGALIASTTTLLDGIYWFTNLTPGDYSLHFGKPAGYTPSPADQGSDDTIDSDAKPGSGKTSVFTLIANTVDSSRDAGFYQKEQQEELDFGDAPDPAYPTLLTNNGARHIITPNLLLGNTIDAEPNGQPSAMASGDEQGLIYPGIPFPSGDEDGVQLPPILIAGQTVPITIVASASGTVNAWLDFNGNGNWADTGEHIITAQPVSGGLNTFNIIVPANAQVGQSYARFRLSSQRALSFDGLAPDGEVEDYAVNIQKPGDGNLTIIKDANPKDNTPFWISVVYGIHGGAAPYRDPLGNTSTITNSPAGTYHIGEFVPAGWTLTDIAITGDTDNGSTIDIANTRANVDLDVGENITIIFKNRKSGEADLFDFGDAPDAANAPAYPTLHTNNGAYHDIVDGFHLGALIDEDADGQPTADAMGDDHNDTDDEDGVTFVTPLIPGQPATIEVVTSADGILNAWFDFNANASWLDPAEHSVVNVPLTTGTNSLTVNVPPATIPGLTFARFRLSRQQGVPVSGYGQAGEVEDYQVEINEPATDRPFKWIQLPLMNEDPDMPYTPYIYGWDVRSLYGGTFVADDWFCKTARPVTAIHWWGSFSGWDKPEAPPVAPHAFHIGVWTDIPKEQETDWSHPGELTWQWIVSRDNLNERVVGDNFHPETMDKPDSCFRYDFYIPKEEWFYQEKDSTIYWLSIAAMYDEDPEEYLWGWKTREHFFQDDAVYVYQPEFPQPGDVTLETEPIAEGWDLAFVLGTDEYMLEFDYGDAPMERYPTLLDQNGALHIYDPRVFLGSLIDPETEGQPDHTCTGDDHHGLNDDDGVVFITPSGPGQAPQVMITASCAGFLNAWMDFNNNGNWTDPGEHIFIDEPLQRGQSTLALPVPEEFVSSEIFSRFRFSTVPGLDFVGIAIDGEVEDYYMNLVVTDLKERIAKTPSRYALYQNYPNPFNPSTELSFDLPNESEVALVIYDLIGERVCDLLNDRMQAGQHRVRWNGKDNAGNLMPTGIYLVHMRAGEFTAMRKIILLK